MMRREDEERRCSGSVRRRRFSTVRLCTARVIVFVPSEGAKTEPVMPVAEIPLKGAHNVENVLAAVCAARLAGVPAETIRASVAAFRAVEHRLEFVRKLNGGGVLQRLEGDECGCVDEGGCVVSRGNSPDSWREGQGLGLRDDVGALLKERVKVVYTIGSAAEKIERELHGVVKMVSAGDDRDRCSRGGRRPRFLAMWCCLSPACSSFDQFENYEHRGRMFRQIVMELN